MGGRGLEKMRTQGGAEGEGHKGGNGDRTGQGHGEFPEENSGGSALESDGKEDHHQTGRDSKDGAGDFLHCKKAGLERGHSFLDVADYVFENDNGVVHDDTDRQNKGEKGEDVDAVP